MKFPVHPVDGAAEYCELYLRELARAAATIDGTAVARAAEAVRSALERDATIYCCGNGGSAAIANHLICDFAKGIRVDTEWNPRVVSLSSRIELILAIANDTSFDDVFAYQLQGGARSGDLLLTISSSGDSENIVRALAWAKDAGLATVALTGFDGGRASAVADVAVHVDAHNYGVVEDLHQSVMHIVAQYLRQSAMVPALVAERRF